MVDIEDYDPMPGAPVDEDRPDHWADVDWEEWDRIHNPQVPNDSITGGGTPYRGCTGSTGGDA